MHNGTLYEQYYTENRPGGAGTRGRAWSSTLSSCGGFSREFLSACADGPPGLSQPQPQPHAGHDVSDVEVNVAVHGAQATQAPRDMAGAPAERKSRRCRAPRS